MKIYAFIDSYNNYIKEESEDYSGMLFFTTREAAQKHMDYTVHMLQVDQTIADAREALLDEYYEKNPFDYSLFKQGDNNRLAHLALEEYGAKAKDSVEKSVDLFVSQIDSWSPHVYMVEIEDSFFIKEIEVHEQGYQGSC